MSRYVKIILGLFLFHLIAVGDTIRDSENITVREGQTPLTVRDSGSKTVREEKGSVTVRDSANKTIREGETPSTVRDSEDKTYFKSVRTRRDSELGTLREARPSHTVSTSSDKTLSPGDPTHRDGGNLTRRADSQLCAQILSEISLVSPLELPPTRDFHALQPTPSIKLSLNSDSDSPSKDKPSANPDSTDLPASQRGEKVPSQDSIVTPYAPLLNGSESVTRDADTSFNHRDGEAPLPPFLGQGPRLSEVKFDAQDVSQQFRFLSEGFVAQSPRPLHPSVAASQLLGTYMALPDKQGGEADIYFGQWNDKEVALKITRIPERVKEMGQENIRRWLLGRVPSEVMLQVWIGKKNHVASPLAIVTPDGHLLRVSGSKVKKSTLPISQYATGNWIVIYPKSKSSLKDLNSQNGRGKHAPLKPTTVLSLASQANKAVDAVHNMGVAHRDIKPDNFLIEQRGSELPRLYLSDFGMASMIQHAVPSRVEGLGISDPVGKIGTLNHASRSQLDPYLNTLSDRMNQFGSPATEPPLHLNREGDLVSHPSEDIFALMLTMEHTLGASLGIRTENLGDKHAIYYLYETKKTPVDLIGGSTKGADPEKDDLEKFHYFKRPIRSMADIAKMESYPRYLALPYQDQKLVDLMGTVFRLRAVLPDAKVTKKALDMLQETYSKMQQASAEAPRGGLAHAEIDQIALGFYQSLSSRVLETLHPKQVAALVLGGGDSALGEAWFSHTLSIYTQPPMRQAILEHARVLDEKYRTQHQRGFQGEAQGQVRLPLSQVHIYPSTPENRFLEALSE